jgi:sialate O-acetylesterase
VTRGFVGVMLLMIVASGSAVHSEVRVSRAFSDGMVLQQQSDAAIWGWARAGETITVSMRTERAKAVAAADGKWMAHLRTPAAGGPYDLTVAGEANAVKFTDVLVGEVWLATGQSNMEFTLREHADHDAEIANSNHPQIRFLTVRNEVSFTPLDDVHVGTWQASAPSTAGAFSAVAYFFAREVQAELKVPVGIVSLARGGTSIQAWMSREQNAQVPWAKQRLDEWDALVARATTRPAATTTKGESIPARQNPSAGRWPTLMYNTELLPVAPYTVRGILWYQGEHHVGRHDEYRPMLPLLVRQMRTMWGDDRLPFYSVQLHRYGADEPKLKFGEFREAQMSLLSEPNTALAIAIDTGEAKEGHPKEKRPIGHRLAALALNKTYGRHDIPCSGPWFESMQIEGSRVRIRFTDVDGGLVVKGDTLEGFTIAGADQKWASAHAKLDGNDVIVWSDDIPQPVAVRYAWADFPKVNLYNRADFPAAPFRTDEWPTEMSPEP